MTARLLVLDGGTATERAPEDLSELRDLACWLDIQDPVAGDLTLVAAELGFHPLAVEDALHGDQRPKIERYETHDFLVVYAVEPNEQGTVRDHELALFVAPNVVVTVHRGDSAARREVEALWRTGRLPSSGTLLHALLDRIVDAYFPIVDTFGEQIEVLERAIVDDPGGRGLQLSLRELFRLKSDMLRVRRLVAPQREVLAVLSRAEGGFVERERMPYFQDVYDHVVRVTDEIDTFRDLTSNVIDAHLAAASNRLNEVMKVLTSVATVLLVLSVITSFFGMNFDQLPYRSNEAFGAMLAAFAVSAIVLVAYFRRRGWL